MGSVYLGRDPDLDRQVAVKTVRNLELDEERLKRFLERFRNEARAAGRLSHPAIVAVYDVGEDGEVGPYLVFEYVAGSTLKQIIRGRGPLAPDAVVRLGRQIASALDTAHAAGIIHRDVKPDNILVSADGDAKLADFGVARVPDAQLTKEGQFLGTPCYAAPETLASGRYGPHSDRFSFAAVMYEAITGIRAFPGDDAISVAHHVVNDEPVRPSDLDITGVQVPKELERVVMRALEKDESKRYESATGLVDAIAGAYISTGVLDRDPTGVQILPTPDPEPKSGGSTWLFAGAVLLVLAVGVGFVFSVVDLGPGDPVVPTLPPPASADAGMADTGATELEDAAADASDADAFDGAPDASTIDAGASERPNVEGMSGHEREEAAKEEIDRAEVLIEAGDYDAASGALERARVFDPEDDDIAELEARLRELRANP